MFARKLAALDFYSLNSFDYTDEKQFRNFVGWLENQKIRLYKPEDRLVGLDRIEDDSVWQGAYEKYLTDLNIEFDLSDRESQIEQLLSEAIKLEYSDNADKYNSCPLFYDDQVANSSKANPAQKNNDPLEHINFNSEEFREGIHRMQLLLNIPSKTDDYTSVLQAISKIICDKLNANTIQTELNKKLTANSNSVNAKESDQVIQLTMDSINLGFDTKDKVLNEAAKILRLLHIKELRDLQTKINEAIVTIQKITANPKTDSSLGKVGR